MLSHFYCVWLFVILWTGPVRLLLPWDSPGKNTEVSCHALLQGIFPVQRLNPSLLCLLYRWWVLYHCPTREIENTKKQMERVEGKSIVTTIKKKKEWKGEGKESVWNSLEEKKPLLTRIVVGCLWDANKYQTLKPLEASVRGEIMWAENITQRNRVKIFQI